MPAPGLTSAEAAARLAAEGPNALPVRRDRALAALDRNASAKIVADWLVLQL